MSIVLAIETSSADYGVAVCAGRELIYHRTVRRSGGSFPGLGSLTSAAINAVGATFADIEYIAVDVGPGSLSSVRTGIAYANGLAFSLEVPIFCANSLELLALAAAPAGGGAVLCLRNAGGGNVYAGLVEDGSCLVLRHGPIEAVVTGLCANQPEVWVAGAFQPDVSRILTNARVKETGVTVPDVRAIHTLLAMHRPQATDLAPVASPITESSEVFRE